jgi:hypothetical protein
MRRSHGANRLLAGLLFSLLAVIAQAMLHSTAFAITEQQAAIVKATVSSLNPSGASPDRPVVLEISTADRYALARWIWGFASGEALLVSDNGAWRRIETTTGAYDALGLEQYHVPHAAAVALVAPENQVEIGRIPQSNTDDRVAGKLGCGYAYKTYYRMNFPIGASNAATEVVHANVFMYRGDAVGWLLRTRKGSLWYADGPGNVPAHRKAPRNVAIRVLYALVPAYNSTLGTTPQDGSLWPVVSKPNMTSITGLGIDIRSCF